MSGWRSFGGAADTSQQEQLSRNPLLLEGVRKYLSSISDVIQLSLTLLPLLPLLLAVLLLLLPLLRSPC
jgi:hypothetical protein